MTEKRLWDYTKDGVAHTGHWDRIESHAATQGRPDVNACVDVITVDIELKVFDPRKGGFVLRANQNAWFKKRVRAGGITWIWARYDNIKGGPLFLLIPGARSGALIHDRSFEGWLNQASYTWTKHVDWAEWLKIVLSAAESWKASPN